MLFFLDHSKFVGILSVSVQALQRCLDHIIANQLTSQNPDFVNYQYAQNKLKKKSKQTLKKKIQLWANLIQRSISVTQNCVFVLETLSLLLNSTPDEIALWMMCS